MICYLHHPDSIGHQLVMKKCLHNMRERYLNFWVLKSSKCTLVSAEHIWQ